MGLAVASVAAIGLTSCEKEGYGFGDGPGDHMAICPVDSSFVGDTTKTLKATGTYTLKADEAIRADVR